MSVYDVFVFVLRFCFFFYVLVVLSGILMIMFEYLTVRGRESMIP